MIHKTETLTHFPNAAGYTAHDTSQGIIGVHSLLSPEILLLFSKNVRLVETSKNTNRKKICFLDLTRG